MKSEEVFLFTILGAMMGIAFVKAVESPELKESFSKLGNDMSTLGNTIKKESSNILSNSKSTKFYNDLKASTKIKAEYLAKISENEDTIIQLKHQNSNYRDIIENDLSLKGIFLKNFGKGK